MLHRSRPRLIFNHPQTQALGYGTNTVAIDASEVTLSESGEMDGFATFKSQLNLLFPLYHPEAEDRTTWTTGRGAGHAHECAGGGAHMEDAALTLPRIREV